MHSDLLEDLDFIYINESTKDTFFTYLENAEVKESPAQITNILKNKNIKEDLKFEIASRFKKIKNDVDIIRSFEKL